MNEKGSIIIESNYSSNPDNIYILFYNHGYEKNPDDILMNKISLFNRSKLNAFIESIPKSKKNRRCIIHSLDKSKSLK